MDEFDLINTCFRPLARGFKGSLNLTDDAAVIAPPAGDLVITTDAISEGIHFIGNEDPGLIAKKLLRVNLSDLAAMGAKPLCYFLTVMLPKETAESWIKRFAAGLASDQKAFHISLAGGDTVSTRGAKSFSITALGLVPKGKALKRSGARAGDMIFVSGTLGDSALGLASLRGSVATAAIQNVATNWIASSPSAPRNDELIHRYLLPQPRLSLGQKLIGIATACMDISDGLVQDLGHICTASGVGATIYRDSLPLSKSTKKLIGKDETLWDCVLGGGDDYELLFTVPPRKKAAIKKLAAALKLPLTEIGKITKEKNVRALDKAGKKLEINRKGFTHF